ncbi:MAG TPA: GNAT family N-acetyltransferase [Rhodothermales bacterium]|nr:GNAT family N-acetyltransferase [Rhodothermales bacterium]
MDFVLDQIPIENNEAKHRFEARVGDYLALADYTLTKQNMIVFTHTEVPPELEGQGLATKLIRTALDHARTQRLTVMPLCPFVKAFILRHPEYRDLVKPGFHL